MDPEAERNLRLVNPSNESQIADIQLHLDGKSLTGTTKLTLGPFGEREYRGLQVGWGDLQLTYRYADSAEHSKFTTNLASQFGADYSGTIQITFLSSGDVDVEKATD